MNQYLRIAKNELYRLYYSPIAWAIMIIFIIMTSLDYVGRTAAYLNYVNLGGYFLEYVSELTNTIIATNYNGYFFKIIQNLYIFFPLITMGLISREKKNGTIQQLYSSPVKMYEIVGGKFLAMVGFTIMLLFLVFLTLIALSLTLAHPDFGHMFASMVGLFFVLCTYAAIGLFISSLTSYAIVAAIGTFAVFALLSNLGALLGGVDAAQNVIFYLNLPRRSRRLIHGLLNSQDLVFFAIITGCFLGFTVLKLKGATESISAWLKAGRYVGIIIVAIAIGYISSRPALTAFWDSTRDNIYTISPSTQRVLAKLDKGPLDITIYVNLLNFKAKRFSPGQKNYIMYQLIGPYRRFKSNINVKYVYYYADSEKDLLGGVPVHTFKPPSAEGKTPKERAKKRAKQLGINFNRVLSKQQVSKLYDVASEGLSNFFVLHYQGEQHVVRTFNDSFYWPMENEWAAGFKKFIQPSPTIVFLTGHGERSPFSIRQVSYRLITSAKRLRKSLINQGYSIDTLSLRNIQSIPTDIAALAIVEPEMPYSSAGLAKIKAYIAAGGNLFVAGGPGHREAIEPVLSMLGLSLHQGRLVQTNKKRSGNKITGYMAQAAKHLSPQFHRMLSNREKYTGDSMFGIMMQSASALEYSNGEGLVTTTAFKGKKVSSFSIKPLLVTYDGKTWIRYSRIPRDSLHKKLTKPAGAPDGPFTTALLMKRNVNGDKQVVIASADADYLSGLLVGNGFNYSFGFWSFTQFSNGHYPANTMSEDTDHKFAIGEDDMGLQKILLVYITPILLFIIGSVIIVRRRRK